MAFAAACFGTVHYQLSGQPNGMPIVFCNSLGTDTRIWDGVADSLSPDYRVVTYDKRGHGLTSVPPAPYSLEDLSTDLLELVDTLRIDRFTLVGISVGGLIAQRFALNHPQRIAGLVLCDTAAKIGDAGSWSDRMAAVEAGDSRPLLMRSCCAGSRRNCMRAEARRSRAGATCCCDRPSKAISAPAPRDADLTDRIGAIRRPTLVLVGALDQSTPVALVRNPADRLLRAPRHELLSLGQTKSEPTGPTFGHGIINPLDNDLIRNFSQDGSEAIGQRMIVYGQVLDAITLAARLEREYQPTAAPVPAPWHRPVRAQPGQALRYRAAAQRTSQKDLALPDPSGEVR